MASAPLHNACKAEIRKENDMIAQMVIVSIVSFLVGWNLSENNTKRQLRKYVTNKMEAANAEPEYERIQIRVEKQGNNLLAYRVDNNLFLSQSHSGKELVRNLKEMFDNKTVNIVIHKDDGAEYIQEYF